MAIPGQNSDRQRLTESLIKKKDCPAGKSQHFVWDTVAKHLGVRITKLGAKSYIFESRINGKTIRRTIGSTDSWLPEPARKEARRLQTLIDQGIDPRYLDKQRKEESETVAKSTAREKITLAAAWMVYIEARRSVWSERTLQDHIELSQVGGVKRKRARGKTKPGPIAALLPFRLSEITTDKVKAWAVRESKTRATRLTLAHRLLIIFANWCEEQPEYAGLLPPNAFVAKVVKESIPKQTPKDDCLRRDQLAPWFNAVRRLQPVMSAYLQGLLLTGARREELATLRWENVDFVWRSLVIKDKVEGSRKIPLTPYMASLLSELKARNETPPPKTRILHGKVIQNDLEGWKPSPWVYPSTKADGASITDPNRALTAAVASAGIPHLTPHGLRRSFATLSEWVEVPVGVVAQIMGHKPSAVAEKHYIVRPLDLLELWHTKIEAWILEQAGIETPKKTEGLRLVKGKNPKA